MNAIYFKSEWAHKFDGDVPLLWHNSYTSSRRIEGMTVKDVHVLYLCRDDCQIVTLPYKGGHSMVIFLPPKDDKTDKAPDVPDVTVEFFRDSMPRKNCKS